MALYFKTEKGLPYWSNVIEVAIFRVDGMSTLTRRKKLIIFMARYGGANEKIILLPFTRFTKMRYNEASMKSLHFWRLPWILYFANDLSNYCNQDVLCSLVLHVDHHCCEHSNGPILPTIAFHRRSKLLGHWGTASNSLPNSDFAEQQTLHHDTTFRMLNRKVGLRKIQMSS